jgi:hypothetical protein
MNDNLLDATLDDLADLPAQGAFPAGVHKASMILSAPTPKPGKRQLIVAKFKHQAVVEMKDPAAVPPAPGDESTLIINMYKKDGSRNEYGEGQLKMLIKPLADGGLSGSTRELIEATKPGVDVTIVCSTREYEGNLQMVLNKIDLA